MTDDRIFRLEARLKNNRLVKARLEAGFRSCAAAARAIGINNSTLCALETMRDKGRGPSGFTATAQRIAIFYGHTPEYLWPEALASVQKTTAVLELSEAQVGTLLPAAPPSPLALLAGKQSKSLLSKLLAVLTPIEWRVVQQRFAEEPATFDDISKAEGLSRERLRQIEQTALHKMQTKLRFDRETSEALRDALRQGDVA